MLGSFSFRGFCSGTIYANIVDISICLAIEIKVTWGVNQECWVQKRKKI